MTEEQIATLLARIAQDEYHAAIDMDHFCEPDTRRMDAWVHAHMRRVLADCAAKRAIVDLYTASRDEPGEASLATAIGLLAEVYDLGGGTP
jgi:hypothetical protein